MNHQHHDSNASGGTSRGKIALVLFLGVAAFFLLSEHRAHLFGYLPYLLLLACPLMHLFHHGGHGGHGGHRHGGAEADGPDAGGTRRSNES